MERLLFENTERLKEALTTPINSGGVWFYDPQCDNPLSNEVEKLIDQMGELTYLSWLCETYNVEIPLQPRSPHEARRTARKVVRNLPIFVGERYIQ